MKKTKKKAAPEGTIDLSKLLWVDIREMKPNPLHEEWQRRSVRGLIYNRPVQCSVPECGKKKRGMWTMLCTFKVGDMEGSVMVLKNFPGVFAPLTPVCSDHPISPAINE